MTTITFKSNRDGNSGTRGSGFASASANTYTAMRGNEVVGSVESYEAPLSALNPAFCGRGTVWGFYDNAGECVAKAQTLNELRRAANA